MFSDGHLRHNRQQMRVPWQVSSSIGCKDGKGGSQSRGRPESGKSLACWSAARSSQRMGAAEAAHTEAHQGRAGTAQQRSDQRPRRLWLRGRGAAGKPPSFCNHSDQTSLQRNALLLLMMLHRRGCLYPLCNLQAPLRMWTAEYFHASELLSAVKVHKPRLTGQMAQEHCQATCMPVSAHCSSSVCAVLFDCLPRCAKLPAAKVVPLPARMLKPLALRALLLLLGNQRVARGAALPKGSKGLRRRHPQPGGLLLTALTNEIS